MPDLTPRRSGLGLELDRLGLTGMRMAAGEQCTGSRLGLEASAASGEPSGERRSERAPRAAAE
jgi:hypothetical protein